METLPNPNSQPGTNGPEEMQQEEKLSTPLLKKPLRKRSKPEPVSESEPEVVAAVGATDRTTVLEPETLSPADVKLAIRMNRHIMTVLGLDKRSRSFRV